MHVAFGTTLDLSCVQGGDAYGLVLRDSHPMTAESPGSVRDSLFDFAENAVNRIFAPRRLVLTGA